MPKKTDIPTECTCEWEKRIVYVRESNGTRTEDEQAKHVWISPNCILHKRIVK